MLAYNTKQRKLLLEYLSEHTDEKISAKQIASALIDKNISLSAVYRNLSALEKAGLIKKCSISNNREIFYQYIDKDDCKKHLHLSCKMCGRIFHLNSEDSDIFIKRIEDNERFVVDKTDTVVYGVCHNCR